jgi:hypothetical protein
MSNVLNCRFFPVPRELLDGGHLGKLSFSALRLYLCLLGFAQKHSAVVIELHGKELRDYTGIRDKQAGEARRELVGAGFISMELTRPGTVATYRLLNPETRQPLPAPQGRNSQVPCFSSRQKLRANQV